MAATASSSADPGDPHPRRSVLGVIFLTLFIDLVGFSIIFPLFPAMLDYYLAREAAGGSGLVTRLIGFLETLAGGGDNRFFVTVLFGGILGSLYSLLQFLFSPIWGSLSDRFGRRNILLVTVGGTLLSYLLWIFSASFEWLLVARLLGGLMAGNISVATAAVADTTGRSKRSGGMAIVGVAFGLGFILGPAIGGLSTWWQLVPSDLDPASLGSWGLHPFSGAAIIAAILAAINWVWVLVRFPETLPPEKRKQAGIPVRRNQLALRGRVPVMRVVRLYFILILAFSGMEFTLTFLAVERFAYTPMQNGMMFVFIGVILALVQGGIVRRLAPRIGEIPLIKAGLLSGLVAYLCLALSGSNTAVFYTGLAAMALCIGLASPTLQGLVSLYVNEQEQGKYLGIQRAAGSFARAIGPFLAAGLYFGLGSTPTYLIAGAILLVPLMQAFRLPGPSTAEPPE